MKVCASVASGAAIWLVWAALANASVITSSQGLTFSSFPIVQKGNDEGPETFGQNGDVTYTSNDPGALYGYTGQYGFGGNGFDRGGRVLTGTAGDLTTPTEINFAFAQPVYRAGFTADWTNGLGPVTLTAFNSSGAAIESLALADANGANLETPDSLYGFSAPGISSIGISGVEVVAFDGLYSGVPEPSIWALLIAGLSMIGGMLRFRRRSDLRVPA